MAPVTYEPPRIDRAGSLHDLTQQFKTFGSADGIILVIPGVGSTDIGSE